MKHNHLFQLIEPTSFVLLHLTNPPNRPTKCNQHSERKILTISTQPCSKLNPVQLDRGGVVGAVFLDLPKSSDTVNYNVFLSKLSPFNSYLTMINECTLARTKLDS
jgi:hypothetical protein